MLRLASTGLLLSVLAAGCGPADDGAAIDRSGFYAPDELGPYRVHRRALEDGRGTLYLPSTRSAAVDPGLFPRPLVVFAPGFSASEQDYRRTLEHLASHGFAVVGAQHDFNFATASLCRTQRDGRERVGETVALVRRLARERGELRGLLADDRFAMAGHSYGGKLALWIAAENGDVPAAFALDPVDGGDERRPGWCPAVAPEEFPRLVEQLRWSTLPPLVLIGAGRAGECAPDGGNARAFFAALTSDVLHLQLPEAAHQDFVDAAADDDCLACGFCPASRERASDVQRLARGSLVAFFKWRWIGDDRYVSWLGPGPGPTLLTAPPVVVVERK